MTPDVIIETVVRSSRLLSSLLLLQAHGKLSTRQLAEHLRVSRRTAHRDMEALCFAGIPLIAIRGAEGGWQIEKSWRTRVPGFDEAELRALLMAQPGTLGDLRLVAAAERALSKLMAAMPVSMQEQAASIRARVHIDPDGWGPGAEDLSALPAVQEAVTGDRRLSFDYQKAGGTITTRTVDPFGVVCKQAIWYLVARTPSGMRTFRVSRMSRVVVLAGTFRKPKKFDLMAWWKTSTAELERKRSNFPVVLALSPEKLGSNCKWLQATPITVAENAGIPAGWSVFSVNFPGREQARFVCLGLGSAARVLEPAALAAEIASEVREMAARH